MSERKKIAAITTTYQHRSHADVLLGKFISGFPTDDGHIEPRVEVASVYLDQIHENDMCIGLAKEYGFEMHESIQAALCLGGKELAVDAVLIVGEHGDYPWNEKDQHLYPRKYFFEQVCGVFAYNGRSVPVFNDKHLSYNWADTNWMWQRARELEVPFMAGSSIPYAWRSPWIELEKGVKFDEVVAVGYGGTESYGFHMLEGLQCMVERREGGEVGVNSVQCLEGDDVWRAAEDGLWSSELAAAACSKMEKNPEGDMKDLAENPVVFLVEYRDGLKAAAPMLNGYASNFGFAATIGGEIQALDFYLPFGEPWAHFSYLGLNIEEMFITGEPIVGAERTVLTSGILEAAMNSRHDGYRELQTPHLDVAYESYDHIPFHPQKPRPVGPAVGTGS